MTDRRRRLNVELDLWQTLDQEIDSRRESRRGDTSLPVRVWRKERGEASAAVRALAGGSRWGEDGGGRDVP